MTRSRTIFVWLTAAMTMAAGLPQTVCACPGRPAKNREASIAEACPCGGSCCGTAASSKCCDGQRGPVKPDAPRQSGQTVCKKTVVAAHAHIATATNGVGTSGDSVTWLADRPSDFHVVPSMVAASTTWELPFHSPPYDLLLLFQRFLI